MRVMLALVTVLVLLLGPSVVSAHDGPITVGVGSAHLWLGLQSNADQGARFDVRTELWVNETVVAEGESRCVTGLKRGVDQAKEVKIEFGPVTDGKVVTGDVLALRVLTRVGTRRDGTPCGGPQDTGGLRLYYDAKNRDSRVSVDVARGRDLDDNFLRAVPRGLALDTDAPRGGRPAKEQDSRAVGAVNGNPWIDVGTWRREVVLPPPPGALFSRRGPGGLIADGSEANIPGTPFRSTITVPHSFKGPISRVWVELHEFQHAYPGDVRARLIHPDGVTSIDLFNRPGRGVFTISGAGAILSYFYGYGSRFVPTNRYVFSDNGTVLWNPDFGGGPPGGWQQGPDVLAGEYRPSTNINPPESADIEYRYEPVTFDDTFRGKRASGVWTLEIVDWAEPDAGSLGAWTLNICTGVCPAEPAEFGDEVYKLTAFDPLQGSRFGGRLALRGDIAIIGEPDSGANGFITAGAAHLVDLTTGRRIAYLPLSVDQLRDHLGFGSAVAINGTTALVGVPSDRVDLLGRGIPTGSVFVYDISDPSNPVERPKLFPSDADGNARWDFGFSVALKGNFALSEPLSDLSSIPTPEPCTCTTSRRAPSS